MQPRSSTALFGTGEVRIERFGWIFCPGDKVMQVENDSDMEVYNRDLDVVSRIDSRKVSSSLEVNLFGAYHCARLAIPHLRRGGGKNHRNRFRSWSQRFDPADLSIGHRLIGTSLHYWGRLRDDRRGARHWARIAHRKLHMRVALSSGCFLGFSASSLFGGVSR